MEIVELRLVPDNKKGIVDYSALKRKPEPHEEYTAEYFARRGYDVTFLKTSNIKGSHSPDFLLIGRIRETLLVINREEKLLTIKGTFDKIKT